MTAESISENPPVTILKNDRGLGIACRPQAGSGPGILFIGGYKSAMTGEKARFLSAYAAATGRAFTRFDPSGHGESEGVFEEGTIGQWLADTLLVLDRATGGPQILVGSSMGGWLMVLAALARPERATLKRDGVVRRPSRYGGDYIIAAGLLEEARRHLVLRGRIGFTGPVRLLHGMADPDVPWQRSLALIEALESRDARLHLVKDGDHRLSRPEDLALLARTLEEIGG